MKENLIKSKQLVQKHGEVFTPSWMVQKMLDTHGVKEACKNVSTTFLESSTGDGNFLQAILERKLAAVVKQYDKKNLAIINCYKVLTTFANNIGTNLSDDNLNIIISHLRSICTETYLVVGAKLNLSERAANNFTNYLKTKFVKFLISLAKANQNGTQKTYRFLPLQYFTENSDIDWSQSISEIDQQLYRKYNLSKEEIDFSESKVKEMG